MDYHISEDEDVQKLKEWWRRNGPALLGGVAIGLAVVFGVNWWRDHLRSEAETASALYEKMMIDYSEKHRDSAVVEGAKLMRDYEGTPYGGKAALFMARMSFESGDMDSAESQLRWAVDNAAEVSTQHAARIRLARLFETQGRRDDAMALLEVADKGGFESAYAEVRGDLLAAEGKTQDALLAYREALKTLPEGSSYAGVLEMKIDDLGEGAAIHDNN